MEIKLIRHNWQVNQKFPLKMTKWYISHMIIWEKIYEWKTEMTHSQMNDWSHYFFKIVPITAAWFLNIHRK